MWKWIKEFSKNVCRGTFFLPLSLCKNVESWLVRTKSWIKMESTYHTLLEQCVIYHILISSNSSSFLFWTTQRRTVATHQCTSVHVLEMYWQCSHYQHCFSNDFSDYVCTWIITFLQHIKLLKVQSGSKHRV